MFARGHRQAAMCSGLLAVGPQPSSWVRGARAVLSALARLFAHGAPPLGGRNFF